MAARTSQEYVIQELRGRILRGELKPGDKIRQASLAAELDVSNTPVREGLQVLAAEGLVSIDPRRGAVVTVLDQAGAEEIYMLRQVLEPLALRLAIDRVTPAELDEAERLITLMDSEEDPAVWVDHNRAFHAIFTNASGSPRLASILGSLRDGAAAYVGRAASADSHVRISGNQDHRELVAAFRARDLDQAVDVEQRHLAATIQALDESAVLKEAAGQLG